MPAIVFDPNRGGSLIFEGTKISVKAIGHRFLGGDGASVILQDYPELTYSDIYAAADVARGENLGGWAQKVIRYLEDETALGARGRLAKALLKEYRDLRYTPPKSIPFNPQQVRESLLRAREFFEEKGYDRYIEGHPGSAVFMIRCLVCRNVAQSPSAISHGVTCRLSNILQGIEKSLKSIRHTQQMSDKELIELCSQHGWDWEITEDDRGEVIFRTGMWLDEDDNFQRIPGAASPFWMQTHSGDNS